MTNKTTLIERIARLARDGKLEGISDLRDESDRQGMRIVIELSRNTDVEKVLETLYKRTQMQNTFSIIMLALVDGEPRMLSLKNALLVFVEHRLEIVRRRSEYDLARAKHRQHILAGYRIALDNLDEVIDTIRRSRTVEIRPEPTCGKASSCLKIRPTPFWICLCAVWRPWNARRSKMSIKRLPS